MPLIEPENHFTPHKLQETLDLSNIPIHTMTKNIPLKEIFFQAAIKNQRNKLYIHRTFIVLTFLYSIVFAAFQFFVLQYIFQV